MKVMSLFSGVGGFELGLPEDYQVIGHSEINKYASDVLRYHYPNIKNYGDITKINWNTVPDFDLLVGGSPCQSFSVAGKREGLDGKSGLFWEYIRCLKEKKPEHFIWENVKGVLSSDKGTDFAAIINSFSEAGYSLWWQVLNAKDFGVPQNRERVFVVGSRTTSPREVFFEKESNGKDIVEITQNAPDAQRVFSPAGIGRTLKGLGGGQGAKSMLIPCALRNRGNGKEIETRNDHVANSITSAVTDSMVAKTIRVGGGGSPHGSKQNWDSYEIEGMIRRLTPRECERLMSWSDDWTRYGRKADGTVYEMSDSQRYKMCGNGVVSNVIKAIINSLEEV